VPSLQRELDVHVAARAGPGEVLVSAKDLAAGSGIQYADRPTVESAYED
jgi:hypothetical protein